MKEDPFSGLYGLICREGRAQLPEGNARLRLGTVVSMAPLKVDVAGTMQEGERFFIAHRLISGHKETLTVEVTDISGALSILASCGMGSHGGMDIYGGTVRFKAATAQDGPVLAAGDQVLLLTADDETFYILDKVVRCT